MESGGQLQFPAWRTVQRDHEVAPRVVARAVFEEIGSGGASVLEAADALRR
jgi:hypothetical protein